MAEFEFRDDVLSWMKLSLIFGSVNNRFKSIHSHHLSAELMYYSLYYDEEPLASPGEIKLARLLDYRVTDKVFAKCKELGIKMYSYESPYYPQKFRQLPNAPMILFVLGSVDFLKNDISYVEFVGTRNPSDYTKEILPKLIEPLSKLGVGVVTGFADGVDRAANRCAKEFGAPNVVFLGNSIEREKDFDKLQSIAEGGAVVSEFIPTLKKFMPNSYSMRNRLMTAMSDAVVICEEGEQGKGLDNVGYAESMNKKVLAVPPADIYDTRYFGQRDLIRRGCPAVFSAADIIYHIGKGETSSPIDLSRLDYDESYLYNPSVRKLESYKEDALENVHNKPVKKKTVKVDTEGMNELSSRIVKLLEQDGPLMANELSEKLDVSVNEVLGELTSLELECVVASAAGNRYKLI